MLIEQKITEWGGHERVSLLGDHVAGERPVSDRAHHVLADPEGDDRSRVRKHAAPSCAPAFDHLVIGLPEPEMAEGEGLMAGKLALHGGIGKRSAMHDVAFLLDGRPIPN
jgi:hypothetical protein